MYPITPEFRAALVKSHTAIFRCEIWSPAGAFLQELDIMDGQITVDDVPFRRRYNVALASPDGLVPQDATDLLNPEGGNEVKLYRGIRFANGSNQYIPLGVFGIEEVQIDDSGEGLHVRISGYDRAKKVSDAKMVNAYTIADGTNVKTALQALILARFPTVAFSSAWVSYSTTATLPRTTLVTGDDPWNKIQKIGLESLSADIYFDVGGELTIVPVADPSSVPTVWTYQEGPEATFLYFNKNLNTEDSPNHIIVFGEHPDNTDPIRGEAYDSNPSSPTRITGPYGDRVKVYEGQTVKTAGQATAWATAILNKTLGVSELVRFNAIVNPGHEVGDLIGIDRPRSRIYNVYVIDKLTIPLVIERAMEVATRRRKL